jgi:hypothetical protein
MIGIDEKNLTLDYVEAKLSSLHITNGSIQLAFKATNQVHSYNQL